MTVSDLTWFLQGRVVRHLQQSLLRLRSGLAGRAGSFDFGSLPRRAAPAEGGNASQRNHCRAQHLASAQDDGIKIVAVN
jgi:hypothetical protein